MDQIIKKCSKTVRAARCLNLFKNCVDRNRSKKLLHANKKCGGICLHSVNSDEAKLDEMQKRAPRMICKNHE